MHHYGAKPGFVLLGGLVPQLLCSNSAFRHAGTTDVDVQVDLEFARGATHTRRLEQALTNAEFRPDSERVWRWEMRSDTGRKTQVKFELLADLVDQPQGAIVRFDHCAQLGAVNLRGTGYAARDVQERTLHAKDGGILREVQLNVSGLGGFLMAKAAAANGRNKPKDWYDIAYVLLHNDDGPTAGADAVTLAFGPVAVLAKRGSSNFRPTLVTKTAKAPVPMWSNSCSTIPTKTQDSISSTGPRRPRQCSLSVSFWSPTSS